jgi:two-component system, OmpR family, phosphate regulon sensor histidine kinase PhoR
MNVSRILSLTVFVMVVAVFRWLSPAPVWESRPGLVVSVMGAAAVAAVVHWCLCHFLVDRSLAHLNRQVMGLAERPGERVRANWLGWPPDLGAAIDRSTGDLSRRIEELQLQLHESQARATIAESGCQRLEVILRAVSDGVLITDACDQIVLINDAAAKALGVGAGDSRHKLVDQVVADPALVRSIRETRFTGDTQNPRRFECALGVNGSTRLYEVSLVCAADPGRPVYGVVTVLRDVTQRQQLAAVKSDLVCGVSHELRTPLSSIRAYAEMLLDGEVRDEATRRDFYTIIQSEAQRLTRLIENVLNISRIESGMLQVQRERVGLAALAHEVVEILQPYASSRAVELREAPAASPCHVSADRDMIYQAILNLVSNAIKYTPQGGTVCVEVTADEAVGTSTVQVVDTGVGIPPDELPRVFEKFYRVREHRKLAPGTGLGLNLVKQIVETVHHGLVSVNSSVGRGTAFSMTLPLAVPDPSASARAALAPGRNCKAGRS